MLDRIGNVPNFFYDFIVFFTPTIGMAFGIAVGLTGSVTAIESLLSQLGLLGAVILFVLLFLASYEYGRLAETFSDFFVVKIIHGLQKLGAFKNSDYRLELSEQVALLPFELSDLKGRTGSKWTLFFFAQYVNPQLGSDLLKRYAWEKLARSSCLTVGLLFLGSFTTHMREIYSSIQLNKSMFQFGGIGFTGVTLVLYFIFLVDFYKRNCWNNDLLITTLPVILANYKSNEQNKVTELRTAASKEVIAASEELQKATTEAIDGAPD